VFLASIGGRAPMLSPDAEGKPEDLYIGRRLRRREDPRLLTGTARYTDDLPAPDALHLAVLRSDRAHARITRLEVRAALAALGVVGVAVGKSVGFGDELNGAEAARVWAVPQLCPPIPIATSVAGMFREPRWPLAIEVVRFVGDPVAAVVASSAATARDALDLIEVEYDSMPTVADVEQAVAPGAPSIYSACPTNVSFEHRLGNGSPIDPPVVVRQRIVNQRVHAVPMEPRAITVRYEPIEGELTIWVSTQMPHRYRNFVADAFGVPEQKLRVIAPEVGGAFGAKCELYPEEMLAIGWALGLHRTVRWTADRQAEFQTLAHGRGQVAHAELSLDEDGRFLGLRVRAMLDLGAYYQLHTALPAYDMGTMAAGPYLIPRVDYMAQGVFTNRTPTSSYRGVGRAEATFLLERMVDIAARRIGIDPIEIRRRNLLAPEAFPYRTPTGATYDSGDYEATLDRALAVAEYTRLLEERDHVRGDGGFAGVGVTCYTYLCGLGPSREVGGNGWESCSLRVERTGTVTVLTGISPHGQGEETSFSQIVADGLGVSPGDVAVVHGDTAKVPFGIGSYGSRGLVVGGGALQECIKRVVEKARLIAAHMLEVAVEDVTRSGDRYHVRGGPAEGVTLAQVARAAYLGIDIPPGMEPGLSASMLFHPENLTYPHGTHICLVEVEPETGKVHVRRYVAVDDCGKVISPLLVEGQVHGGLAQGIGQALFEGMVYDNEGQLQTGSLGDYPVMVAQTMPVIETFRTETPSPHNPLGAKGIGEAGAIAAPPTVVSAVCDALGVDHVDMPLTPERLWRLLRGEHQPRQPD